MLPTAASCPSSTTCYGVGFQSLILKTTDGKTWREPTPYTRLPLSALACPGAGTCYAVGAGGLLLTTSDGGASWVRRSTGATGALPSIACPSLGVCLTTDLVFTPPSTTTGVMLRTTDGGQTWSTEKGIPATRVTCPSSTVCYATGATFTGSGSPPTAVVLRSSDAGRTWAKESTLPKGYTLTAIACSSTTTCIGVGGESPCIDDLARRDMRPLGSDTVGLRPDQQGCREAGWLFSTADGGRHWVRQFHRTLAPGTTGADLLTAGCPTPTLCYAAGYGIWIRATFASRGWTVKLDGVTPIDFVQSLSCLPPNTCWGIGVKLNSLGGVPVRTTNGGASWQVIDGNVPSPGSFPQAGGLTALDCPSPTRCFAVGNSGLIMAYSP
jgi:photosystem II stability/assembly factor-like uncharacterized protein